MCSVIRFSVMAEKVNPEAANTWENDRIRHFVQSPECQQVIRLKGGVRPVGFRVLRFFIYYVFDFFVLFIHSILFF